MQDKIENAAKALCACDGKDWDTLPENIMTGFVAGPSGAPGDIATGKLGPSKEGYLAEAKRFLVCLKAFQGS